ncbi:hypothetical protein KRR23_07460 [Pseudomonas sp. CVAP|uniref:hypothetical protein n=1 Tax=Pseudomonas sp. CVAP\|nr:hypothetical protein [Pseudomonas sp. CVAP\
MFNVVRPFPAPACLSEGKYNHSEVVDLLHPMFYGKCYLCEQDELSSPEIEHFDPHEKDVVKKFDWSNLYYSCGRCNSIKSNIHKDLLDCCDASLNVFRMIKCVLPSIPSGSIEVKAMINPEGVKVVNTVNLLHKCYNEDATPLRGITRSVLMERLFEYYTDFLGYRFTLKSKKSTTQERELAKGRIESMLEVGFPFSVFWRWHVIEDSFLSEQLKGRMNF